jgi:molybdopterin/thiamine biosynthesis adenylyltransferase
VSAASERFSDEEVRRYSRQIVLADVGGVGQERLRAATLAAECEIEALYLAAAGVGTLRVPSSAIADAVRSLNPHVKIIVCEGKIRQFSVEEAALAALSKITEALAQ